MNKKRKIQLIVLVGSLLVVLAAFLGLRVSQQNTTTEVVENESYVVTDIDTSLATEIGIITSDGTINLLKNEDGWMLIEDESISIDSTSMETYLQAVGDITSETKIEDVKDFSQYGLNAPSLNITLQWDSNMYNIKVGDYNSVVSGYYININDGNTVYMIDSSTYYSLNKGRDDFELVQDLEEE